VGYERDDSLGYPAGGISDTVFLSSRDGVNFDRSFMEAWGLLQTGPEELFVSRHDVLSAAWHAAAGWLRLRECAVRWRRVRD